MALHACMDCGQQVSDRATTCPNCGGPGPSAPQPSVDEWALSRLATGAPRRQVVDELVQQGALSTPDAAALVKRVEAEALGTGATVPTRFKVRRAYALALFVFLLLGVFMLLRAAPGP